MEVPTITLVSLATALFIAVFISKWMTEAKMKRVNLPPGPKGLPLVGNLLDLPKPGELEAHHWLKHKDLYGASTLETHLQGEAKRDH